MAYNIIAGLGMFTTNFQTANDCNILTEDNEIFICGDIEVADYTKGTPILTLSDSEMQSIDTLIIPVIISKEHINLLQNSAYFTPNNAPFTGSTVSQAGSATIDGAHNYYCSTSANLYVKVNFPQLESGKEYVLSYECNRSPALSTQPTQQEITINNAIYYGGGVQCGVWLKKDIHFIANANTTEAYIRFGRSGETTGWSGFFRNFMLTREEHSFFEGTITDYIPSSLTINNRNISCNDDILKGTINTNGIVYHISSTYYNNTIGNVNVTPSSPYRSRI